ncbi:MAG: hypothetical protein GXW99_06900 [Clostridiales bacterium]|nr:hypothetical protein [Clostridiales bacterium]
MMNKTIKKLLLAIVLIVAIAIQPTVAYAGTSEEALNALKTSGIPEHLYSIAVNLSKTAKVSSEEWDYAIGKIDKASKILDGRELSELSYEESVEIVNLATDAINHAGYSVRVKWEKVGATITLMDKDGNTLAKFNTRDTGVNQTGSTSVYLTVAAIGCLLTLGSVGVVAGIKRKNAKA